MTISPSQEAQAIHDVLEIIMASGNPRDAVWMLLQAHVLMTKQCQKTVNIDQMLQAYSAAFRDMYRGDLN